MAKSKIHIKESKKTCSKCGVEKEISVKNFHKRKVSLDGYSGVCKDCRSFVRHKEKHWHNGLLICMDCGEYKDINEFDINSSNRHRNFKSRICKKCKGLQYKRRLIQNRGDQGIERLLTERFCGIRDRAKKNKLILDFGKEYLRELWIKQNGKCALSGVDMTTLVFCGRTNTNISVDRINPNLGYIKGNVQLVCMAVNQMKSDLTLDELLFFCKKIIDNNEYKHKEVT